MQLLTIEQAAERLATTERAVNTLLNRGLITYIDVSAKQNSGKPRKRIREDDLMAFIESRRVSPPERLRRRRKYFGELTHES